MAQTYDEQANRRQNGLKTAHGGFYKPNAEMFRTIREAIKQSKANGTICPACEKRCGDYELIFTADSVICRACFEKEI